MIRGRSGRPIVVVLPQSLAEQVRGLGQQKHALVDTLSSLLRDGRVSADELPEDPLKCRVEKMSRVMLKATSEALDTLKQFAEKHGMSMSQLIRRLIAWYLGYECVEMGTPSG